MLAALPLVVISTSLAVMAAVVATAFYLAPVGSLELAAAAARTVWGSPSVGQVVRVGMVETAIQHPCNTGQPAAAVVVGGRQEQMAAAVGQQYRLAETAAGRAAQVEQISRE